MQKQFEEISWQASRDSLEKFKIIEPILSKNRVCSILDIGCNAGEITRNAGKAGYFAVGIDKFLDFRGFDSPLLNACLGNIELNNENIYKLPAFDAVLLLSVHHQLIANYGDKYTKSFLKLLANKTNKVLMIEFAALNRKYGYNNYAIFSDNDENTILNYSYRWLKNTLSCFDFEYIGKASNTVIEPYRYIFACTKNLLQRGY